MTFSGIDTGLLPPDWVDVRGLEVAERALVELQREMPAGHRLCDTGPQAIAVRSNRKDLVFWLTVEKQWALVHFTGREETDPIWPWTETFETWPELVGRLPPPGRLV